MGSSPVCLGWRAAQLCRLVRHSRTSLFSFLAWPLSCTNSAFPMSSQVFADQLGTTVQGQLLYQHAGYKGTCAVLLFNITTVQLLLYIREDSIALGKGSLPSTGDQAAVFTEVVLCCPLTSILTLYVEGRCEKTLHAGGFASRSKRCSVCSVTIAARRSM